MNRPVFDLEWTFCGFSSCICRSLDYCSPYLYLYRFCHKLMFLDGNFGKEKHTKNTPKLHRNEKLNVGLCHGLSLAKVNLNL